MSEYENRQLKQRAWEAAGQSAFAHAFDKQQTLASVVDQYASVTSDMPSEALVQTAGRVMSRRGHGKAMFVTIQDESGELQLYINVDRVGGDTFALYESIDIGDIIGVSGTMFRTRRDALTLNIDTLTLLTKSLAPLPEKFHGLQDKETRYRQRYVDLIMNTDVRSVFSARSSIVLAMRQYLNEHQFMEVETPVLQHIYGGASAEPFRTHHNHLNQDLYLRIALELHLKRLIVGGYERVFEIGRVFRNEGVSYKHNPEYTLLELYQAYADYTDMMALTEALLKHLVVQHTGGTVLTYQDQTIDFSQSFQRLSMLDALAQYAGIQNPTRDALIAALNQHNIPNTGQEAWGHLVGMVYDKLVEPQLVGPIFITDYPWELSPLAKRHRDNADLVERFELIIAGMEIANAFSELNDPVEQAARFEDQERAREAGDAEAHRTDDDYIQALQYGMPPTGGLGIGVDRVVMLLTNQTSIRDVLFFPHLKQV
jgi:lysyl-tRNA synthetase class 2